MLLSRWLVVVGLLWALIVSQAAELLKAVVGKSLLMSCQLPSRQSPEVFYWQDNKHKVLVQWPHDSTSPPAPEYKDRVEVSEEINSGNISIILHNVTVADDQKWFLVLAREKGSPGTKKYLNYTLQVSAPYQDLQLTFNEASNNVTCTARGGFPKSEVRWSAFNTSSDEEVDLPGTGTSHQEDPTLKTFYVSSSVVAPLRELENVTCRIRNPLTGNTTGKVARKVPGKVLSSDEGLGLAAKWGIGVAVLAGLAGLVIAAFYICKKFPGIRGRLNPCVSASTNTVSSPPVEGDAPASNMSGGNSSQPVEGDAPASNMSGGNSSQPVEGDPPASNMLGGNSSQPVEGDAPASNMSGGNSSPPVEGDAPASNMSGGNSSQPVEGDAPASNMSGGNSSQPIEGDAPAGEDETTLLNSYKKNTQEADKQNNETPSTSAGDPTQETRL
ncbi:selection and upkeep of intraepithelial T-cells protein 7-like [Embiotoca jacksoni]|uniref:selection and upkeep of intraepithelial T-cells protein 7-like n=1 Tax=Embiotoca jacksoni TaxID=100190 RepID=UPI00370444AD